MLKEVIIPGCLFVVRGWLQSCKLDSETIASDIMDETDGDWGLHRASRWVQYDRLTCRFGLPGVTSTLGGRRQPVRPMRPGGVLPTLAKGISMYLGIVEREPLNFVYCNLYVDGEAGIRRHCDRGFLELSPTATIASLSFGEPRRFELWPQEDWKNRTRMVGTTLGPVPLPREGARSNSQD